jgi:hypothetical protein
MDGTDRRNGVDPWTVRTGLPVRTVLPLRTRYASRNSCR